MFPSSPNIRLRLLRVQSITDSIGNRTIVLINSKEVVGINFSITSKEFYESKYREMKIDLAVKIQSFLYDTSKYAEANGIIYKIERTYLAGQFIELYLSETKIKPSDIIDYPG
jgi:hypothetical protein